MDGKIFSLGDRADRIWVAGIYGTTILAIALSISSLSAGISVVFPHLFYLPIVLTSYRYPRYGVIFAVFLSTIYLIPVCFFSYPDFDLIIAGFGRVVLFVAIGFVVSAISSRLQKQWGEVQRRNRQLDSINRIIGITSVSTSLAHLTSEVLGETLELLGCRAGAIYLINRDTHKAVIQHSAGIPEPVLDLIKTVSLTDPAFAEIFQDGVPRYTDTLTLMKAEGEPVETYACAGTPFTGEAGVIGGLVLFQDAGYTFSDDEKTILEAIGTEMGGAIQRSLLQQKLQAANEEANLYLDIMAHDINNANAAAIGYAELLIDILEGRDRDFARKLLSSVQKSVEIIANVSTIRRLHQETPSIRPIQLDPVIRAEIDRFADADITYGGYEGAVMANDLLSEVFTNVIGNSIKFGGTDVQIGIEVTREDGEVLVAVTDNGPGIPAVEKLEIFSRFRRGKNRKSGKGLGLYISRMLIEGYEGRIWAEDRVPGKPEEGVCIKFTLISA